VWWDWGQITYLDCILLSILIPLLLCVLGRGILKLLSFYQKGENELFEDLDFVQKIVLNILFGFAFIFLFVLILSITNLPFSISAFLVIMLAVIGFIIRPIKIKSIIKKRISHKNFFFALLILIIYTAIVVYSSSLIVGFYGTPNLDGSSHTFFTKLVLDSPNILWSHSTDHYNLHAINYPLGTHVLSAFFITSLNVPVQKIIIIMTAILPGLTALAFFSTIKCLFNNKLLALIGLVISGFFSVGFSLAPIWWAGMPLLLSLYLSVSSMGFIFVALIKNKLNWFTSFLIGLLLLVASQTYPVAFLIISLWLLFLASFKLLVKLKNRANSLSEISSRENIFKIFAFLVPILLCIPYLYFVISFNSTEGNYSAINTQSWSVLTFRDRVYINWLSMPAQSGFFSSYSSLFMLVPYSLIILFIVLIPTISKKISQYFELTNFVKSLVIVYFFMLMIIGYLALVLLPFNYLLFFTDPERVWQHIYVFAVILTSVVIFSGVYLTYFGLKQIFKNDRDHPLKFRKNKVFGYILFVFLIINVALISVPLGNEQINSYYALKSSFNRNTLNQTDLSLMKWIMNNTPSDCRILISQEDSGQFVTAVTGRHTIVMESYLENYTTLMKILTLNSSDIDAIPLLLKLNVTYVYIGSQAMTYNIPQYIYRQFNATQMLSVPYFTLVKQYGNASLFSFNAPIASSVYSEFEKTA